MKTIRILLLFLFVFSLSTSGLTQVVNPVPVNLVGSSDPISGDFIEHIFTPSPLGGTYHGGTYYSSTKEKWGYDITELTPGVEYTLAVYYMMDRVFGTPSYNRTADFNMNSGAGLDITSVAYIPEPDWRTWYLVEVTFTALAATDRFEIEAEGTSDNSIWVFTDVDAAAVDVACDPLTTTASPSTICLGEDITFTSTSSNGGTVTWDGGITNGVPFTPASAGTFTYNVTSDFDGDCADSVTVVVNALPDVTATATPDTICIGEEVTFNGGGAETYTWDMGVTDGVPFTPADAGTETYTVTGTDVNDCENTATVDVTVQDLPTVTATATPDEICVGDPITFTGGGADTYVWDGGVIDGTPFTPAAAGSFTFTVTGTTDPAGCENTASVDVTVTELPDVTASVDDDEICEGESVIFTGGGADTYTWDMGVTDGDSFTPVGTGTTTYTVTGAIAGCENTATVDVTVNAAPTVTATASATEICFGETVTVTGGGADSYAWDGGITDGLAFDPGAPGTYTYTVTGTSDGCSNTASVTVTVIECEDVIAAYTFNSNVCVGDCITLTDISTGTVVSWDWDFGGATDPNTSTDQNPIICLNTVGDFNIQLTVTNVNGTTSSVTESLTVNPTPDLTAQRDTIIDVGGEAVLTAVTTSTGIFSWSPDYDVDCDNCQTTTANPIDSTTFTVNFTDENGCQAESSVLVLVNFQEAVGVPTAFSPNGDGINDVLFVKGYGIESMKFVVYNRYGEVVFETTDQNIGWDGTFMGKDENPGVFTWVLHYSFNTDKKGFMRGNTTLIR